MPGIAWFRWLGKGKYRTLCDHRSFLISVCYGENGYYDALFSTLKKKLAAKKSSLYQVANHVPRFNSTSLMWFYESDFSKQAIIMIDRTTQAHKC